MNWTDIKTAPKDGRLVLVRCPNIKRPIFVEYRQTFGLEVLLLGKKPCWVWSDGDELCMKVEPTHWLPIPEFLE